MQTKCVGFTLDHHEPFEFVDYFINTSRWNTQLKIFMNPEDLLFILFSSSFFAGVIAYSCFTGSRLNMFC